MTDNRGYQPEGVKYTYPDDDPYQEGNEVYYNMAEFLNDDEFSQDLFSKQTLIDNILNKFLLEQWEIEIRREGITEDIQTDLYDNKLTKIKTLWKALQPGGVTPESLCYEAIMKKWLQGSTGEDNYFINYSDGAPWFSTGGRYGGYDVYYAGDPAIDHTRASTQWPFSKRPWARCRNPPRPTGGSNGKSSVARRS